MRETQPSPPVLLRPARQGDADLLAGLLAGLSPASLFQRFMAGVGLPNLQLVRGLLRDEARRGALLAVEQAGRREAVGHACWSVSPAGVVDIGVVVSDAAQGRGIGTALFLLAVEAGRTAGAASVHLDVHPENRRLVTGLRRRLGGGAFTWRQGLLAVDLPVDAFALRPAVAA
jgi:ribosomal protein S18 acetylase RimI-like enzyme